MMSSFRSSERQSINEGASTMKRLTHNWLAAGAVMLTLAVSAESVPANAADVKVGVLNCDVSSGWGFVFGSSKDLRCEYSPLNGGVEHYAGSVSKFGVDIGYTRGGVLIWDVVAPSSDVKPGALQGSYAGATVSAAIGVGGGANVLVGGLRKSIALQPISITGESGLNVAAGIGALHLTHVR
jgi:hypothetical protein